MSSVLMYFDLAAVPLYCLWRVRRNNQAILNPLFWLVFFSYFYLTLSSALVSEAALWFSFSAKTVEYTNLLCNWNTFVFFMFLVSSKDYTFVVDPSYVPRKLTYQLSQLFLFGSCILLAAVLVVNAPAMLAVYYDRIEALTIFSRLYFDYHLGLLIMVMIASTTIIVWRTRKLLWFVPLLLPLAFDLLSNGRHITFLVVICVYLNYFLLTGKPRFKLIALILLALGGSALVRFGSLQLDLESVRNALGEFVWTRMTTSMVYESLVGHGNPFAYFISSMSHLVPGIVSTHLFGVLEPTFVDVIREEYPAGFGMAGNIVSEALFYGGVPFAVLSPIIIGAVFFILYRVKLCKTMPGFILFCFVTSGMTQMMRMGFYSTFLIFFYLMMSYLIWIVLLEGHRQFATVTRNPIHHPATPKASVTTTGAVQVV